MNDLLKDIWFLVVDVWFHITGWGIWHAVNDELLSELKCEEEDCILGQ